MPAPFTLPALNIARRAGNERSVDALLTSCPVLFHGLLNEPLETSGAFIISSLRIGKAPGFGQFRNSGIMALMPHREESM
jgi:hypothetical protein